jgi:hypothetical protein
MKGYHDAGSFLDINYMQRVITRGKAQAFKNLDGRLDLDV